MKVTRQLTLRGAAGGVLRTGTFMDREYLIVPVVALVEGVVHAVNSPEPEFVPREELSFAPGGWNGRPVTLDHPTNGITQVLANDPKILEANAFGIIFNARFDSDRLKVEAWLDPLRAAAVGPDAERVIERVQNGEIVEISVGALIDIEKRSGVHNGVPYAAVWHGIVPDHLAMLRENQQGACSVEMGCGTRTASVYLVTAAGLEEQVAIVAKKETETPNRSLRQRLRDLIGIGTPRSAESPTDTELRNALDLALRASVPGFEWIEAVNPGDGFVVYSKAPEQSLVFMKQSFSLKDDKSIELGEAVEVEPVTRFEEVGRAAAASDHSTCGCGGKKPVAAQGENEMNKEQRIAALISSGRFAESDRAWLEASPDQAIVAMSAPESTSTPAPSTPAPTPVPSTPAPAPSVPAPSPTPTTPVPPTSDPAPEAKTTEEYIASIPDPSVREVLQEGVRAAAAKKTALVQKLRAAAGCPFTEEQLTAKPTAELEQLVVLAGMNKPVDFSGRSLATSKQNDLPPSATNNDDGADAPPSVQDRILAQRKG